MTANRRSDTKRITLRMSEVAEQTGVSLSTVKNWVAKGRLVHQRIGGVVLIRPEHLEAFLNAHTEGQPSAPRAHLRSTA
jgi:excisionase family DNA binding protein